MPFGAGPGYCGLKAAALAGRAQVTSEGTCGVWSSDTGTSGMSEEKESMLLLLQQRNCMA